jgi:hypothetical protein
VLNRPRGKHRISLSAASAARRLARRCADARGRRCGPVRGPRVAPHPLGRWLTIAWPRTAPALRGRRIGAAAQGRRVLGPLARPITRLEPSVPSASKLASWPAAQPPPRYAPDNRA